VVYLLGRDEAVRRVHPLVAMFTRELRRYEYLPLAFQKGARHFGAQRAVTTPPPEGVRVAAVGERLHREERPDLPPPDCRHDKHERVGHGGLAREERGK
jgi:hypothetical protein